ncbi:hypothetical protein DDI_2031 [Dickeya dianthicola RNS04.9]|nr:hypothetical protein DDI_2031 [Dickeya dianthicola RNS04.9]
MTQGDRVHVVATAPGASQALTLPANPASVTPCCEPMMLVTGPFRHAQ